MHDMYYKYPHTYSPQTPSLDDSSYLCIYQQQRTKQKLSSGYILSHELLISHFYIDFMSSKYLNWPSIQNVNMVPILQIIRKL